MVSICSLIFKFSCTLFKRFGIVSINLVSQLRLCSTVFSPLVISKYFSIFFRFLLFSYSDTSELQNLLNEKVIFLLIINTGSGLLAGVRWSVCIAKSQAILCISFSRTDSDLWIYHLWVWSKFYHFAQFPVDHLP